MKKRRRRRKRKKRDILKKIYRKYRADVSTDLVYDDCIDEDGSLSTIRVRQRLCKLMGTDVIRLNDREYFETLSNRLQEEYEAELNKEEDVRAQKEEERLRKLCLDGLIKKPTDYRAVVFSSDRKKKTKKKKKKTRKPNPDAQRRVHSDNEDEHSTRKHDKDDVLTQVQIEGGSRPMTASAATIRARSKSAKTPQRAKSAYSRPDSDLFTSSMFIRPPHHMSTVSRSSSAVRRKKPEKRVQSAMPWTRGRGSTTGPDPDPTASSTSAETKSLPDLSRAKSGPTKYSKQDPPLVRELREEETVSGLYSLAEKLIVKRPTASEEREMRRMMRRPNPPKMTT